ncbi:Hsh49p [Saccharomyces cerevisiae x Saccharomyces kudriavzevii VIN7]|uniref:Hsh49p n=1 Tax=Saccharomyces cerevisiae x Saccharomyces kudriavzevii (strain VIN7) TaxID=1095631 RepID=H0H1J6_SACCK|nr:Hsh49p [Saccharomyces cerevisiae x Saccharomyces kudriavzevii VIN7]
MNFSTDSDSTVYVGNIDPRITKGQLYELFIQINPVLRIKYPKDKVLQTYQGYAFIEFYNKEDAEYVIQIMNNTVKLYDRLIKVRQVTSSVGTASLSSNNSKDIALPIAKLFVKNLADSIDIDQLAKIFGKFGKTISKPEIFHLSNGKLKCACVYFEDFEKADLAIKSLNNQLVANNRITIDYAFKENGKASTKYGNEVDRLLNKEALKHGMLK